MDLLKLYELSVETLRNPGAQVETDGAQALLCLPWCFLATLAALGSVWSPEGFALCDGHQKCFSPIRNAFLLLELDTDF